MKEKLSYDEVRQRMQQFLYTKLATLEKKYDKQFKIVFDAIRALMSEEKKPKRKIGFEVKESRTKYGKKGKGS